MGKANPNTLPPSMSLADIIGFIFFYPILNWVIRINKFYLIFLRFCEHRVDITIHDDRINGGDLRLHREDVEEVMGRMGIPCNKEVEQLKECMDLDDLSSLFEEKEPSLEEVKEAFSFFDENRDGFIDAKELQRVLSRLGLQERSTVEACEQMIGAFDENRDSRIDFNEFVNIMERSFG